MIPIPEDTNTIVNMIGIDPGSDSLGCAVISFDLITFRIITVEATTFVGSRLYGNEWSGQIHSDRFKRIMSLKSSLLEVFNTFNPLAIACESPFYNHLRPSAYGVLVEVISMIRSAVFEYDQWRPLNLIDPSTAKKTVGASGGSRNKEDIKIAIMKLPEIMNAMRVDIASLDEHSVDSIAVSYYLYLLYKNSKLPYIQRI